MGQFRFKKKLPKYAAKIPQFLADHPVLSQGGIHHINVLHDSWCPQLNGKGECTCDPELKYIAGEGRN